MKTEWDYTQLAAHYDRRPDYAGDAIDALLAAAGSTRTRPIADVGAGTGKLAIPLATRGFRVLAVEPNDEMRRIGAESSRDLRVSWVEGTGEATTLADGAAQLVTFGSSFNVTDRARALVESARILAPGGWFACLWNHRDLDDPLQRDVETLIRAEIPGYAYGTRREDQTEVIEHSGLFGPVERIEASFQVELTGADFVEAWRSHGTLARQAGSRAVFARIVDAIEARVAWCATLAVPYTTRVWCARRRNA